MGSSYNTAISRLRRAPDLKSPISATASCEVLSLDNKHNLLEETYVYCHETKNQSIPSCYAAENGVSNPINDMIFNAIIAIFSDSVFLLSQTDKIEASERNSVKNITFCPTFFCKKITYFSYRFRNLYQYVRRLRLLWWGSAKRNDCTKIYISSGFCRNDNYRPSLYHFWHNKPSVITHYNLPSRWRMFNRHSHNLHAKAVKASMGATR